MEKDDDELNKFFVDENEPLNKKILAEIIEPFVESIRKNEVIEFKEDYEKLPAWKKILIYLSCRKAMFSKKILKEESIGPKKICEDANISHESAKNISRDKNLKNFVKRSDSKYFIPNYKLKKVKDTLIKNGSRN